MVSIQVYIREDQHKKLKKIYAETGQRITESVRQALDSYLEKSDEDLL
jgi:hypothetical protein